MLVVEDERSAQVQSLNGSDARVLEADEVEARSTEKKEAFPSRVDCERQPIL